MLSVGRGWHFAQGETRRIGWRWVSSFGRLDVPIVFNRLEDRWFVAVKPAGFVAPASDQHPSVEAALTPFCGGRELSFPIRPEKDAQGLLIVTTDGAIRKVFDDLVRRRLVRSIFRVLADVSLGAVAPKAPEAFGHALPDGLEFLGGERLAAGQLLGSLWAPGGGLLKEGSLRSRLAPRPLKLRAYHPTNDLRHVRRARRSDPSASGLIVGPSQSPSGWQSPKGLREGLAGEAVPLPLLNVLSKSLLAHSRSPQSARCDSVGLAVTDFELLSGPAPALAGTVGPWARQSAVFLARAQTSGPHQVRAHFADAGCPVLFDTYYHPAYNVDMRRNVYLGSFEDRAAEHEDVLAEDPALEGKQTLGLQLCELELPDPYQPSVTLRISLRSAPLEWQRAHAPAEPLTSELWPQIIGEEHDEDELEFLG